MLQPLMDTANKRLMSVDNCFYERVGQEFEETMILPEGNTQRTVTTSDVMSFA